MKREARTLAEVLFPGSEGEPTGPGANARQYLATARFHDRTAQAYDKLGKHAHARAARQLAERCRTIAAELSPPIERSKE